MAKATPDGHTLLLMETSSVLHKWLHTPVPYDVVADFAPIARVATSPMILFAQPAFPANDARELIALAKAQPGKLSVGTPGIGTPHHLAMLMLNALAKIDIVNVPYRGAALVLNDVLAGQIPLGWAAPTAVMPHVASGKMKVLAVASGQRAPSLPQVPTIAEGGVPGFDLDIWFGVAAPAQTPPDIIARYAKEIAEIAAQPDVKERIDKMGLSVAYTDGETFRSRCATTTSASARSSATRAWCRTRGTTHSIAERLDDVARQLDEHVRDRMDGSVPEGDDADRGELDRRLIGKALSESRLALNRMSEWGRIET